MHDGDLRQPWRAAPAIDRQGQGATHPDIVKRLFLVVDPGAQGAVPVARLNLDLAVELLLQLVDRRGRVTAEFGGRPVGADRVELDRLLRGKNPDKTVKIRQSLMIVIGVAHSLDGLPDLVTGKFERPGTHDVLLVPVGCRKAPPNGLSHRFPRGAHQSSAAHRPGSCRLERRRIWRPPPARPPASRSAPQQDQPPATKASIPSDPPVLLVLLCSCLLIWRRRHCPLWRRANPRQTHAARTASRLARTPPSVADAIRAIPGAPGGRR